MTPDLIRRHAAPLPRYTSYPTANHFNAQVGPRQYRSWLETLAPDADLSLYLHIPFCQHLCWYCGCSTKAARRYDPVAEYLPMLDKEIAAVSALVPPRHRVSHIHWGGGSPNILNAHDATRLGLILRQKFQVASDAEFAVEIDPRLLGPDQADALAEIGVNRISLGVQDFDLAVQKAIGREQSYEQTLGVVEMFRARGIGSINIDLVYGLPHQTEASVERTIDKTLALDPDRIAIFGYAHLPSRLKHQRLIDQAALPGPVERYQQARRLASILIGAGYVEIGLDHFARRIDSLATKPLARNFQGYTTDRADAIIGLGASAISKLPDGFAQNAVAVGDYGHRLESEGLATARGTSLTTDDRVRAAVIERLMCDFSYASNDLHQRFGIAVAPVVRIARSIVEDDRDGFVEETGDGFRLTPRGRPFVRNIAARFDSYLAADADKRRHALSV